jgi:MarR family 2-MHQ and catechol resistance regulon transcriptional repressor
MNAGRLQHELKKKRPFASLDQEVLLNILRTNDQLQIRLERLFRQFGLTSSQYNVLRILRGEGDSLPITEIASRTVTVVPGMTGVIDRLETAEMVRRDRSAEDRRVIYVEITPKALEVLAKLDKPLMELHAQMVGELNDTEKRDIVRLMEKLRSSLADHD